MRVKISFWISVFIPFGYIPRSGTGGSYSSPIFFFFFGGFSILFSIVTVPVSNVYFLNSRRSLSHTHTHIHTYTHKQPCLILCDPMDYIACQPPPSMGIRQARVPEWVATPFSRGSFWPRDRTLVTSTAGRFFTIEPSGKPIYNTHTHTHIYVCAFLRYITDAEAAGKWKIPEVSLSKRTTTTKNTQTWLYCRNPFIIILPLLSFSLIDTLGFRHHNSGSAKHWAFQHGQRETEKNQATLPGIRHLITLLHTNAENSLEYCTFQLTSAFSLKSKSSKKKKNPATSSKEISEKS